MNRKRIGMFQLCALLVLVGLIGTGVTFGAVGVGEKASLFSLQDVEGRKQSLEKVKDVQMTVLYFFDAESQASQEGLLMLDTLLRKHGGQKLAILGITRSSRTQVATFAQKAKLKFPLLLDDGQVSKNYNARLVLPVVCILDPDLKIIDYYQGGGKAAEDILLGLAQSQLHRNKPQMAEALGTIVAEKNTANLEAKAIQGFAALKQGQPEKAQQVFQAIEKAGDSAQGRIISKEGQVAVLAYQGKTDSALKLAEEVTRKSPKRGLIQKIKGDLLAAKGDTKAAEAAYSAAVEQTKGDTLKQAEVYNQLGRLYAREGDYGKARVQFDRAVELDPYYLEPTSNRGVTFEKEGDWSLALQSYRKALTLNQADTIAGVLAAKAEKMLAIQKDSAAKERMDRLIKDLVERYREQKKAPRQAHEDLWTSRPMVMTFVDVQESGGLSARDGLAMALTTRLGDLLDQSGRVKMVERQVVDMLISELNLGSSELADTNTALKLGKILAAKLIGTGSMIYLPDGTLVTLRLIDTETSAIAKTISRRLPAEVDLERELFNLNRDILKSVMAKYPLQGFVVQVNGKEVILNLGISQGVAAGSAFKVIEEGDAIEFNGKTLRGTQKTIGRLEVVRVEQDYCYARIVDGQRTLNQKDKVIEVLPEMALKDNGHDR